MLWFSRHRLIVLAAICLFWTGAIMLVRSIPDIPFVTSVWSGEQVFEDLMQREGRKTATRPDFAFIGIDQNSLQLSKWLETYEIALGKFRERDFAQASSVLTVP